MKKIYIPALLFMISLLFFAGCSRTVEQSDTLAVADQDGVGHITVRDGADEVSLVFTLAENGTLLCALRLPAS